jgi:hypothetical protein
VTGDAEPLELDSTRTFLGRVSLEYKEWWNQFPRGRRTVKQIEGAPKNPVQLIGMTRTSSRIALRNPTFGKL